MQIWWPRHQFLGMIMVALPTKAGTSVILTMVSGANVSMELQLLSSQVQRPELMLTTHHSLKLKSTMRGNLPPRFHGVLLS
jgi:hypothetical protein